MRSRTQGQLNAAKKEMAEHTADSKKIIDTARSEKRDRTEDENAEIAAHTKEVDRLSAHCQELEDQLAMEKRVAQDADDLGVERGLGNVEVQTDRHTVAEVKSLGEQFIESKGYKDLMDRGLNGEFSSGMVDLEGTIDQKAIMASTPGTALTPAQYVPGIVETLYQRLYVADLLSTVNVNTNQVQYVVESTATNAAAAVSEAQLKPESTLVFSQTTEPIRKIATTLPIPDELLEDAPQVQAYVNSRLVLFVKQTEEQQLLLGTGTAPQIAGLLKRPTGAGNIGTYTRSAGTTNERAILNAAVGARGSSFLDMDAVVIHPTNWLAIRAGTDANGQYFGGGPFNIGPYGGPDGPASSNHFSADALWGMRVVVSSNITVGTALVGSFSQGAALYRRSGVSVEATNSHSTWFYDNITALRAEERLGLAVYRPSSFVAVVGLA
jgi:HK97 family phage major capsid protein